MNWADITEALETFQQEQEGEFAVCANTEENERDEWGNDCTMYENFPNMCGTGDTDDFVSGELCCACGGGSTADQQTCEDTNGDALDDDGFGCNWYANSPEDCGNFDNSDFVAAEMCCGCGGGKRNDFDPTTAEVDSVGEILEQADNAADVALAIIHNPQALLSVFGFGGGGDDDQDDGVVQGEEGVI